MSEFKMSHVRMNYSNECEEAVNKQINLELFASYNYLSMATHFERSDVALPGFAKFFRKSSEEEREHAEGFMKIQNLRGGRVMLEDINKPEKDDWGTALEAMNSALQLERDNNESLLQLHKLAETEFDPQLCGYIESEYLHEQVQSIDEINQYITSLVRVGDGLGTQIIDKHFSNNQK